MAMTEFLSQPLVPVLKPLAAFGGDLKEDEVWVDLACQLFTESQVKIEIGKQIDFVDQADGGSSEHMGVFLWFVLAFGDADDGDLGGLAQIKEGRADQIADVFDE